MANLTFTTTNWGTTLIPSPNQITRNISDSLQNSIRYLDGLDQVSEDVSSTVYRAGFDNDGVLTATGSGFNTSFWRLNRLTYSEPANQVGFRFSGDLQINTNSEQFGGSLSSLQVKLFNLELAAAGTLSINSSGNGTGVLREVSYKQSGVTVKIEDSSITYNGFQASGTIGKVTVTSPQGNSLAISDSSKLTAPLLNNLQSQSWAYFFSAEFLNGNDRLVAGNQNDDFSGFAGHDRLFGKGGNDKLGGGVGNDSLYGENGNDVLRGDSGDDVLNGGPGVDTMTGGAGNDLYYVDSATDRVIETASSLTAGGKDIVYSYLSTYTLPANVESIRLLSTATANATGNGLGNTLFAGAGNNVLNGGAGVDTVSYNYAASGVTVSLADTGTQATGGSRSDRLISIENLSGSKFGDKLTGNSGDNALSGGAGNDRIVGGAGNDLLNGGAGVDTMIGGAGNDAHIVDSRSDVVSESLGAGSDTLRFDVAGSAAITVSLGGTVSGLTAGQTYSNIENLTLGGTAAHNGIGSTANNQIAGNAAANRLYGHNGNDALNGGAGNDTLDGGAGADTLMGGIGNDRFVLSSASTSDTIGDFRSAIDKLAISQSGIRVGNGNEVLTSSTVAGPGGFSNTTELVVVTGNIGGAITASSAAAKIGAASAAYSVGRTALFGVDNGAGSALYLFTAANADASVSAGELQLLAMMTGTPSTVVSDYLFVA